MGGAEPLARIWRGYTTRSKLELATGKKAPSELAVVQICLEKFVEVAIGHLVEAWKV